MKITQTGNGKVEIDVEGDIEVSMIVYAWLEELQKKILEKQWDDWYKKREGVK